MDIDTDHTRRRVPGPVRRLLLAVTGLASVIELFDDAVVELFDEEETDQPAPTAA